MNIKWIIKCQILQEILSWIYLEFILNLQMTKFSVLVFPIISRLIGCLEVLEVANIKYEKNFNDSYMKSLVEYSTLFLSKVGLWYQKHFNQYSRISRMQAKLRCLPDSFPFWWKRFGIPPTGIHFSGFLSLHVSFFWSRACEVGEGEDVCSEGLKK